MRHVRTLVAAQVAVAVGIALAPGALALGRQPGQRHGPAATTPSGIHKIKHVIVIMQENRSFDSYFGTFPGADGIPKGVCLPDPRNGGCRKPFADHFDSNKNDPHSEFPFKADVNGGKMNGFVAEAEKKDCAPTGSCRPDRDGVPHRVGHPELLGIRQELRAARPHVRVGGIVEPACPPVRGLRVVGEVLANGRPDELHRHELPAGTRAGKGGAVRLDRPDVAACTATM